MKKIYLLLAVILLLTVSCKKEELDPLIGKWEVTQRSPYSYEQTGNPPFDPNALIDIKPGNYSLIFSGDNTYTSDNTTYITVKSSGTYFASGDNLRMTQEKVNDKSDPLIKNYKFVSGEDKSLLTLNEINNNSAVIAIIKLKRVK